MVKTKILQSAYLFLGKLIFFFDIYFTFFVIIDDNVV